MTPQSIVQWFGPPEFARADLKFRARGLWIVSWPFFAVVAVLLGIAVLVDPHTLDRRITTVLAVGGLMAVLHTMSRAGRPLLASWLLVTGLSVIVTQRAWVTGGIHAPVALFYALFIIMGGVLLGLRGAVATAAACTLGGIALAVGTARGWLAVNPSAGSALEGFVFMLLAIALALVLHALVSLRSRRQGLDVDAVQLVVTDLRSPMQGLMSNLELLRHEVRGESAQDVDAALDVVKMLHRFTNSLLEVSRLEAGRRPIRRSVVDLSALSQTVVSAVRVDHPARDIVVATRGDSACNCDPDLTRRIIENLVNNAVASTTNGGRVRVVVDGSQFAVSVAVADEGPPVPLDQRSRIFDAYRTDRPQRTAGDESSGVALAFCRLAAEAHGGLIRVEDGTPHGNVFVVELPR